MILRVASRVATTGTWISPGGSAGVIIAASSGTATYELTLRVNGSTIEADVDGVNKVSVTDTDIASGKNVGAVIKRQTTANGEVWLDNWTAVDI